MITGTPIWVWAVLGYLIFVGILALKPRIITLYKLILMPVALIILKFKLFSSPDAWIYILTLAVGITAGVLKARTTAIHIFKDKKHIQIPGSSSLIVVLIGIFAMKYYFGYLQATDLEAYVKQHVWELALSGLLSGYFTGQRANYLYRYFEKV